MFNGSANSSQQLQSVNPPFLRSLAVSSFYSECTWFLSTTSWWLSGFTRAIHVPKRCVAAILNFNRAVLFLSRAALSLWLVPTDQSRRCCNSWCCGRGTVLFDCTPHANQSLRKESSLCRSVTTKFCSCLRRSAKCV
jgi:hypothetical protein